MVLNRALCSYLVLCTKDAPNIRELLLVLISQVIFFFKIRIESIITTFLGSALYLVAVATIAAFIGQHVVRKVIIMMGRASIIIFVLSFVIFVSAISLGE